MLKDYVAIADTIGVIAGILVLSSFIPQLCKAYKTKKMIDVSIYLMSLIASGCFMGYLWYNNGRSCHNWYNVTGFILNVILIILKLKYDKMHRIR
jgi:MtN3 and saliva related transmembrane protein